MIDQKDIGILIAMLLRLKNDIAMNKAINTVLLQEMSRLRNSEYSELKDLIEKFYAKEVIENETFLNDIIQGVFGERPPKYIEDFLKKG